jgi:hypothetical protein
MMEDDMWEELNEMVPIIALGIYMPLILIEIIFEVRAKSGHYSLKDTLCSMTTAGFYLGTKTAMKGITPFLLYIAWEYRFFELELGWAPDGKGETTRQKQRQYRLEQAREQ